MQPLMSMRSVCRPSNAGALANGKQYLIIPTGGGDFVPANKHASDRDVIKRGGDSDGMNVAKGDTPDPANGARATTSAT